MYCISPYVYFIIGHVCSRMITTTVGAERLARLGFKKGSNLPATTFRVPCMSGATQAIWSVSHAIDKSFNRYGKH